MLRNDIKNICSKLAKGQGIHFQLMNCYNLINDYCKTNCVAPLENIYKIVNGKLFINNNCIGVVKVTEKVQVSDFGCYMENRILARQENIF